MNDAILSKARGLNNEIKRLYREIYRLKQFINDPEVNCFKGASVSFHESDLTIGIGRPRSMDLAKELLKSCSERLAVVEKEYEEL